MNTINVCYICNDNYVIQMGLSILSLISNCNKNEKVIIYLIDMGITDKNLYQLNKICDVDNVYLQILKPVKIIGSLRDWLFSSENDESYISKVIRLFLNEVLPDIKKVLYVDCDTIITRSLYDLYVTEFHEPIAAVIDANFDFNFTKRKEFTKSEYFNSGVLLIDLTKYGLIMNHQKIISILKKRPTFPDQDTLNIMFKDNFHKLPPIYNSSIRYRLVNHTRLKKWMKWDQPPYSDQQLDEAKSNPAVIHYTWSPLGRPWEKGNLDPDKMIWNEYYKMSPWSQIPLNAPEISKKKRLIRKIYKHCPIDFYMTVEYQYFKHDFLKNHKKEIS